MPADGSGTALFPGLLVLTVVSIATLAYVGRSRLKTKYLSSANDSGNNGSTGDKGNSAAPAGVSLSRAAVAADSAVAAPQAGQENKEEEEEEELPALLTASPCCWQNPLVLGFNKLKPRTTLGAFSSAEQARCAI